MFNVFIRNRILFLIIILGELCLLTTSILLYHKGLQNVENLAKREILSDYQDMREDYRQFKIVAIADSIDYRKQISEENLYALIDSDNSIITANFSVPNELFENEKSNFFKISNSILFQYNIDGYQLIIGRKLMAIDILFENTLIYTVASSAVFLFVSVAGLLFFDRRLQKAGNQIATAVQGFINDPGSEQKIDASFPAPLHAIRDEIHALFRRLDEYQRHHASFARTISHELKTPLSKIRLELSRLENADTSVDQGSTDIISPQQNLVKLADDAIQLFDELLEIGEVGMNDQRVLGCVDLAHVTEAIIDLYGDVIGQKKIRLYVNVTPAQINGNYWLTLRMVANLIDNAIKACKPGGHLHIETGKDEDHAIITIKDDGAGVPHTDLADFFSGGGPGPAAVCTTDYDTGSGIGLRLVWSIAKIHQASVTYATDSSGCAVTVRWPAWKAGV